MANLINALVAQPSGFWEGLIFGFNNVFANYAVAIVLLTICIKIIMLPIDYFNRRSTAKMQSMQTKIAPKITEIKKKYPDPQMQNQKLNELYTKEGLNPMGSCLSMLAFIVVSTVVFFSLFGSLNTMASYKIQTQYSELQRAYVQEYVMETEGKTEQEFKALEISNEQMTIYINAIKDSNNEQTIARAKSAVKQRYSEVKESFLWVKNVWIADSPTSKEIPDYETYCSIAGITATAEGKTLYNAVMGDLQQNAGVNGFFILSILTGVTAFLNQYLLTAKKKKKENFYTKNAEPNPAENSGKAMLIIMPIVMVVFTLGYNSIFALYIVTS